MRNENCEKCGIELTKSEIERYNDTESGGADLCLHRRVINPD